MRQVILSFFVLLASAGSTVFAQSSADAEARLKLAKEVLDLTRATASVQDGFSFSLEQQKKAFLEQAGDDITADQRRELDLTIQYLGEELADVFPEFYEQIAKLYADKFSLADLMAIRDFFASDVGKRYAEGGFELGAQTAALGQEWFAEVATDAARRSRARAIETLKGERR